MSSYELDPLEDPLTEHPSGSVYQMRSRMTMKEKKEDDQCSDEQEEETFR